MVWYVGEINCGVCGWKDRCRDGNLRTYCRVSPILFGSFFLWTPSLHVLHFCKMLFLELVSGDFLGEKGLFWGFYNTYMFFHFLKNVFPVTCFCCFWGVKRYHSMWFCEVEIVHRES